MRRIVLIVGTLLIAGSLTAQAEERMVLALGNSSRVAGKLLNSDATVTAQIFNNARFELASLTTSEREHAVATVAPGQEQETGEKGKGKGKGKATATGKGKGKGKEGAAPSPAPDTYAATYPSAFSPSDVPA
jgi:hypothetical protein